MNKVFKKIAASIVAVTSLVVSMTSFSANAAVEPRYGGSRNFTVYTYTATATIDRTTTGGTATTACDAEVIKVLTASITVKSSAGNAVTDVNALYGHGTVYAHKDISNCISATSSHHAETKAGSEGNTTMAA